MQGFVDSARINNYEGFWYPELGGSFIGVFFIEVFFIEVFFIIGILVSEVL